MGACRTFTVFPTFTILNLHKNEKMNDFRNMTILIGFWAHYNFDLQMGRVGNTVVRPLRKIISNLIYYSFL